jgi:hypothetical protein
MRIRRLFLILLALPLAGCFADQKKSEASCQQTTEMFLAEHANDPNGDGDILQEGNLVQDCLHMHGYEYSENTKCEKMFPIPAPANVDDATMFVMTLRKTSSLCYAPTGWLDRKFYDVEMWFTS